MEHGGVEVVDLGFEKGEGGGRGGLKGGEGGGGGKGEGEGLEGVDWGVSSFGAAQREVESVEEEGEGLEVFGDVLGGGVHGKTEREINCVGWVGSSHLNRGWASLEWRELWASLRLDPFYNIFL